MVRLLVALENRMVSSKKIWSLQPMIFFFAFGRVWLLALKRQTLGISTMTRGSGYKAYTRSIGMKYLHYWPRPPWHLEQKGFARECWKPSKASQWEHATMGYGIYPEMLRLFRLSQRKIMNTDWRLTKSKKTRQTITGHLNQGTNIKRRTARKQWVDSWREKRPSENSKKSRPILEPSRNLPYTVVGQNSGTLVHTQKPFKD